VSLVYRILYRVGFTPWDTGAVSSQLSDLLQSEQTPAVGRALDIGCGTGTQSVYMAQQGWEVTGLDDLEQPLRRARARAQASGVAVQWVRGNATRLTESGIAPGFDLVFDRGCFHGLNATERAGYVAGVTQLAAPNATLLMMCFARNDVRMAPAGADKAELVASFSGWELASSDSDRDPGPPGPLRDIPRSWYRFLRR
jgi:cyclopropane fatty-acyl-phospholipid synthase-like methyltransferase